MVQRNIRELDIYLDRGNLLAKLLMILWEVHSKAMSRSGEPKVIGPLKMPTSIRVTDAIDDYIEFKSGKRYLAGSSVYKTHEGIKYSPMDQADKIKTVGVLVAKAIAFAFPNGIDRDNEILHVNLIISKPFEEKGVEKKISTQVKSLSDGFIHKGNKYDPTFVKVMTLGEGSVVLSYHPEYKEYNGAIDVGGGNIQGFYRHTNKGVVDLPLDDAGIGGCNLWLEEIVNDPAFGAEIKKAGLTKPPSVERLSQILGGGNYKIRGIDLTKHLARHNKVFVDRVINAANSIKGSLARMPSEEVVVPNIILIGGGACLLSKTLSASQRKKLEKHNVTIDVIDDTYKPDFLTVESMRCAFDSGNLESQSHRQLIAKKSKKRVAKSDVIADNVENVSDNKQAEEVVD